MKKFYNKFLTGPVLLVAAVIYFALCYWALAYASTVEEPVRPPEGRLFDLCARDDQGRVVLHIQPEMDVQAATDQCLRWLHLQKTLGLSWPGGEEEANPFKATE